MLITLIQLTDLCPPPQSLSGLYLCLCLFSGGVTEAAAGATAGRERRRSRRRRGRERCRKCEGRLRARCPLRPQPGSHGACSSAGAGGAAEAARAPDEGAGEREGQAAAGGDPGHRTRSVDQSTKAKIIVKAAFASLIKYEGMLQLGSVTSVD